MEQKQELKDAKNVGTRIVIFFSAKDSQNMGLSSIIINENIIIFFIFLFDSEFNTYNVTLQNKNFKKNAIRQII